MGYASMGKIMWIDLGRGTIRTETVPDRLYATVLSGVGMAVRLLFERIPPGADPLGPDNVPGFVSGPLTGTGSLFTGRWMVAGKSTLTGGWGDANCGGNDECREKIPGRALRGQVMKLSERGAPGGVAVWKMGLCRRATDFSGRCSLEDTTGPNRKAGKFGSNTRRGVIAMDGHREWSPPCAPFNRKRLHYLDSR